MRSIWGFWLWLVGVKKKALATSNKGRGGTCKGGKVNYCLKQEEMF